jgi:hypothetical protein
MMQEPLYSSRALIENASNVLKKIFARRSGTDSVQARGSCSRPSRSRQESLLRWLMRFEKLSSGVLRFVTGHYVTVAAIKP